MVMLDRVMVRRALLRGGSTRRPEGSREPVARSRVQANLTPRLVLPDPVCVGTSCGNATGGALQPRRGEGETGS